jgi:hypothetical protein
MHTVVTAFQAVDTRWPLNKGIHVPVEDLTDEDEPDPETQTGFLLLRVSEFITRVAFAFHPVFAPPFDESFTELLGSVGASLNENRSVLLDFVNRDLSCFFDSCAKQTFDSSDCPEVFVSCLVKIRDCLASSFGNGSVFSTSKNREKCVTDFANCIADVDSELSAFQACLLNKPSENPLYNALVPYWKSNGGSKRSKLAKGENELYECYVTRENFEYSPRNQGCSGEKSENVDFRDVLDELRPLLLPRAEDWAKRETMAVKRCENPG